MLFFTTLIKEVIKQNKIHLISISLAIVFCFCFNQGLVNANDISTFVSSASQEYQVSAELIKRIICAESSFNEKAVSHCDARGLMQITRPTWDWITQQYLEVDWDFDECAFDPEKNIVVGTRFLQWISDYLDAKKELLNAPKRDLVLACYNAGPGNVRKFNYFVPPFKETQDYIEKINNESKIPLILALR